MCVGGEGDDCAGDREGRGLPPLVRLSFLTPPLSTKRPSTAIVSRGEVQRRRVSLSPILNWGGVHLMVSEERGRG